MPKFTSFGMSEDDYNKLKAVTSRFGMGGLCVAISLDWLERIYQSKPLPESFAEENLDALAQQQNEYFQLAKQSQGNTGFVEYLRKRGYDVTQIATDSIGSSGEIEMLEGVKLEPNTGYILSFSESAYGVPTSAHVLALYQGESGREVRDQNVGQQTATSMKKLQENYQRMIQAEWNEVLKQRQEQKDGKRASVDAPEYRRWRLYKVTPRS